MKLHLLGQPRLVWGGEAQPVLGYGALVLAWLALQPKSEVGASRLRLARTLWPDQEDEPARRRLANVLYRLKRDFPCLEPHLYADPQNVRLSGLEVDTVTLAENLAAPDSAQWLIALDLYQGDLLEDFEEGWLEESRAELRGAFLGGLQQALAHFENLQDAKTALRLAQRWVAADPLNEEAHARLMRWLVAQNRTAEALAQYRVLEQTLRQELGCAPRRDIQAFVQSLQPAAHRTLVGRGRELGLLADRLTDLRAGQGGGVLLEGEPGMGKTRLLEEVAQLATWHRLRLVQGQASELQEAPYAPLDSALQGAGWLWEMASPLMRETLKPLLGGHRDSTLSSPDAVGAALERWLLRLEGPLVVLLDDGHWAGELFWAMLPVLDRVARQQPLLWVLSYRGPAVRGHALAHATLAKLREGALLGLELAGLDFEACRTLARMGGKNLADSELERLYRLSGGNPLVLGELLAERPQAEPLEGLLRQRFERLDATAKAALEAASVLGNRFEPEVWDEVLGLAPPLKTLIEARFLQQDGNQLAFQHDLFRTGIYTGQTPASRQAWHARAFGVLRGRAEPPAALALHAREGGLGHECAALYLQAAREALQQESLAQCQKYLGLAQTYLAEGSAHVADGLQLRLLQLHLDYARNPTSAALDELDALERGARGVGLDELWIDALLLRLKALAAKGDLQGYRTAAQTGLAAAQALGKPALEVPVLNAVALTLAGRFVDPVQALPLAERADQMATAGLSAALRFGALNALMTCHARQKNLSALERTLQEAQTLFEQHPELAGFELALRSNQGLLYLFQDRYEAAAEAFRLQLEASRVTGHGVSRALALQNLTLTLKMTGQYQEALVWAEEMADLAQVRQGTLDLNKTAYYLSTLAELLAFLKRPEEAEAVMQPLEAVLEGQGMGDGEIKARTVMAVVRRSQGRYHEGYDYLLKNLPAFANNPANQVTVQLFAAEMAWLAGLRREAQALLTEAAPHKAALGKSFGRVWWGYVSFLVEGRERDLEDARMALLQLAADFTQATNRQHLLASHYACAVLELWEAQKFPTWRAELRSAEGHPRTVCWTVNTLGSDRQWFLESGKVGLRRHRLRRLVLEAFLQDAVAQQSELAEMLGVSLRTVESDLAALRLEGLEPKRWGLRT